jgi:hypothetical protein
VTYNDVIVSLVRYSRAIGSVLLVLFNLLLFDDS